MTELYETIFVVTRIFISASDQDSNGHSDCEVIRNRDEARRLFYTWREEELNLRKEASCDYNIHTDNKEKFHCSWDNDSEMLVLTMAEKVIKS